MKATSSPNLKRGRPRDPRRDQAILDAALELVAEIGYDRMTIEGLATRAGVSKPTVYLRWPGGKPEVVAAAITARRAATTAPDSDTGSLRGDLVAYVQSVVSSLERNVHLTAGLTCQLRQSPELAEVFREHAVAAQRARVAAVLDRAAARGELAGRATVTPLFSAVAGSVIHTHVLLTGEPVDAAFVDELVDHVLLPILSPRRPA
jgi:AcrR family transcriptional regulator